MEEYLPVFCEWDPLVAAADLFGRQGGVLKGGVEDERN